MKTPETDEIDTAPEQWRSQCLVARIQRDEAIKSADKARAYKRVLKEENARLRLELGKALKSLENSFNEQHAVFVLHAQHVV